MTINAAKDVFCRCWQGPVGKMNKLICSLVSFACVAVATAGTSTARAGQSHAANRDNAVSDSSFGPSKSGVALPRNTATASTRLGSELQHIERQRSKNAKPASAARGQTGSRVSPQGSSIKFRMRSTRTKGASNNLGNGSGSVRSGAGRRVSEKRR